MREHLESDLSFWSKPLAMLIFENGSGTISDYPSRLSDALGNKFRVASIASCIEEIWDTLLNEIPAVIVIDLMMRNIDALGFIRSLKLSKFRFDIRYYLCCSCVNDSVKGICKQNDLDGAFSYGDDVDSVSEQIYNDYIELSLTGAERRLQSVSQMISDGMYFNDSRTVWELGSRISEALLVPLGFDAEHKGTKYLEFVICLRVFGAENDMNKLYIHTSECFFTTPSAVEKAIRYSIERAWNGSSPYMQYRLFGNSVDPERGKPTASEFVETIVRHTLERLRGYRV